MWLEQPCGTTCRMRIRVPLRVWERPKYDKSFTSTGRNPFAQLENLKAKNRRVTTNCYVLVLSSQKEKRTARQLRGLLWWGMQGPGAAGSSYIRVGRWGAKWLHYTKKYHYHLWHRSRPAPRPLFQLTSLLTKPVSHILWSSQSWITQSSAFLKDLESSSD